MATDNLSSDIVTSTLNVNQNNEDIVVLESLFFPNAPLELTPALSTANMILAQNQTNGITLPVQAKQIDKPEMVLAECGDVQGEVPPPSDGSLREISGTTLAPGSTLKRYWGLKFKENLDVSLAKVNILDQPKNGKVTRITTTLELGPYFQYFPKPGYLGQDKITFLVEVGGKRIKVIKTLYIVPQIFDRELKCQKPSRISLIDGSPNQATTWALESEHRGHGT
ncbi:hypothetical protein ACO0K9_12035 [Undibacterium sp. Ji50W]|uniref:hypothetical protein n=1 Tax=Undibacterium sp. Ji50W TaxID=3413041 RepID=UPI003BF18A98